MSKTASQSAKALPAPDTLRQMYVTMLKMRRFEEKVAELLLGEPEIRCPVHLYTGQEAVAAGVCANLHNDDYVFSTHRSHGHYIAKGGDLNALMAELFGKVGGCSGGRGGSMHLAAPEIGFPGSSAIVAGTIPLAVGAALASKIRKKDTVSVVFFGEGAVNEGVWYESLNFAALKKLPVIFVCENNLYVTHMPIDACLSGTDIHRKAQAFGMPGVRLDGNNVVEVYQAAGKAIQEARQGKGPMLLECLTYRWRGHVGPHYDLEKGLRSEEELKRWMQRCPLQQLEKILLDNKFITMVEKERLYQDIDGQVETALDFARQSPYPEESTLLKDVFSD